MSGPRGSRWVGFVLPYADAGALCIALVHLLQPCCAAAALPPVRVWVGCAIGFGVGAWTLLCVGAFNLPGVAAAALPPGRSWVAVPLGFRLGVWPSSRVGAFNLRVLLRRLCRRGALGWLCRLGLGWVLAPRWCVVAARDIAVPFPLINNRPLSEGDAGFSRLGVASGYLFLSPALLMPGRSKLFSACRYLAGRQKRDGP